MPTLTTPIVGSHFRPPAKQVLTVLPLGTPLILRPEPLNPYDENAIMVLVSLRATYPIAQWVQLDEALSGTGYTGHQLLEAEAIDGPLQLGYIPKSGTKTCKGGPGNLQVIDAVARSGNQWPFGTLSTSPEGYPTVTITTEPA